MTKRDEKQKADFPCDPSVAKGLAGFFAQHLTIHWMGLRKPGAGGGRWQELWWGEAPAIRSQSDYLQKRRPWTIYYISLSQFPRLKGRKERGREGRKQRRKEGMEVKVLQGTRPAGDRDLFEGIGSRDYGLLASLQHDGAGLQAGHSGKS